MCTYRQQGELIPGSQIIPSLSNSSLLRIRPSHICVWFLSRGVCRSWIHLISLGHPRRFVSRFPLPPTHSHTCRPTQDDETCRLSRATYTVCMYVRMYVHVCERCLIDKCCIISLTASSRLSVVSFIQLAFPNTTVAWCVCARACIVSMTLPISANPLKWQASCEEKRWWPVHVLSKIFVLGGGG